MHSLLNFCKLLKISLVSHFFRSFCFLSFLPNLFFSATTTTLLLFKFNAQLFPHSSPLHLSLPLESRFQEEINNWRWNFFLFFSIWTFPSSPFFYKREQHIKWGENCISLLYCNFHLFRDASKKRENRVQEDNDDDNVKRWLYYAEWILWSYIFESAFESTNADDLSYYPLLSMLLEPNTLMRRGKVAIQFRIESTIAVIISIFFSI